MKTKIIDCQARPNYVLWIKFSDGLEGEVNLQELVGKGIFSAWESPSFFEQVRVDPESGTVAWGQEIDLDPYILRQTISSHEKSYSRLSFV